MSRRLAQVSIGTISNVLNKPELVAPDTRRRVLEAIDKLGWVRNESARQLRAGRSASIGLVVMDIANPFFSDLARGVGEVAAAAGCSVLLSDSAHDPARERAALELYQQLRVRGVILAPISNSPDGELARRLDMPVVLADRFTAYHDACTVSVDDFVGGQLAAEHLLERGHRRLAAVGGTADIAQVRERRDGASRAVLLGNPDATLLTLSTERLDIEAGRSAALRIMAMPDGRTSDRSLRPERPGRDRPAPGSGHPRSRRPGRDQHRRLRRHRVRRRCGRAAVQCQSAPRRTGPPGRGAPAR